MAASIIKPLADLKAQEADILSVTWCTMIEQADGHHFRQINQLIKDSAEVKSLRRVEVMDLRLISANTACVQRDEHSYAYTEAGLKIVYEWFLTTIKTKLGLNPGSALEDKLVEFREKFLEEKKERESKNFARKKELAKREKILKKALAQAKQTSGTMESDSEEEKADAKSDSETPELGRAENPEIATTNRGRVQNSGAQAR